MKKSNSSESNVKIINAESLFNLDEIRSDARDSQEARSQRIKLRSMEGQHKRGENFENAKNIVLSSGIYFVGVFTIFIVVLSAVVGLSLDIVFLEKYSLDRNVIGVQKVEELFTSIVTQFKTIIVLFIGFLLGQKYNFPLEKSEKKES